MKKRTILLFTVFVFYAVAGKCTDSTHIIKKNALYLEVWGKAVSHSINYDRIFRQGRKLHYSFSIGFADGKREISIPVSVNAFTKARKHHAEFGIGITPSFLNFSTDSGNRQETDSQIYLSPTIGYRYQKLFGGIMIRAGVSPQIFIDPPSGDVWNFKPEFKPTVYFAAGFSF